jgi:O-antigen polymerase
MILNTLFSKTLMNFYLKKIASILAGLYIPGVFAAYILVSGYLENQIVVTVCTVATLILIPVALLLHSKACFTRTDLVVSCLLVYLVLNLILHNHATDPFVTIKYLSLFLIYLLARLINARAGWIFSIMAVGLVQAVIAILQSLHLLSGNNQYFNITGTFGNPGQLGGFLAVSFLLSLSYLLLAFRKAIPRKRKPVLILILSGNLIITLYAVALTGSRAAWLAILAGIIVLIATSGYKPPTLMKIFFPVGIILIGVMMWFYKPDSASGRVLIWKITAERITDKPLFGYGLGSFNKHYFTWQADYFKENPGSKFILLAGHPGHPFTF